MPDYRRNRVPGGTYFFTVNLLERRRRLLVEHVDALRAAVRSVRDRHPFHVDAWVVLPDHLHCLWTLPSGDADYSRRWKAIKTAFAKAVPREESLSDVRRANNERGIWQRRFWEHTIRDERDCGAHGLHLIQPGQAWMGGAGCRLALFLVSPACAGGGLSGGLGWW